MLIDEFLSPTNFNLKTSNVDDVTGQQMFTRSRSQDNRIALTSDTRQPISTLNSNILQICLCLEGFEKFAQVCCDFKSVMSLMRAECIPFLTVS